MSNQTQENLTDRRREELFKQKIAEIERRRRIKKEQERQKRQQGR